MDYVIKVRAKKIDFSFACTMERSFTIIYQIQLRPFSYGNPEISLLLIPVDKDLYGGTYLLLCNN